MNSVKITMAAVALLGLGFTSVSHAAPCQLTDVTISGANALGCAGAFAGNDALFNGPNQVGVNDILSTSWTGTAPDPADGWLFGARLEEGKPFDAGELSEGSLTSDYNGNFTINVSPFLEFIIAFKQGSEVAFYYFLNDGAGTYNLSWAVGGGRDFSHTSVYVRGEEVRVPEPATLALLGLGLVGFGVARRRRS